MKLSSDNVAGRLYIFFIRIIILLLFRSVRIKYRTSRTIIIIKYYCSRDGLNPFISSGLAHAQSTAADCVIMTARGYRRRFVVTQYRYTTDISYDNNNCIISRAYLRSCA